MTGQPDHAVPDAELPPTVMCVDSLHREIEERAISVIAAARQLTDAAGGHIPVLDRARVLLALVEVEARLTDLLCRIEPRRGLSTEEE